MWHYLQLGYGHVKREMPVTSPEADYDQVMETGEDSIHGVREEQCPKQGGGCSGHKLQIRSPNSGATGPGLWGLIGKEQFEIIY